MSNSESRQEAYASWRQHNNGPQKNTEFSTYALLRDAYPAYHVTETSLESCDLIGYAEAGHATATHEDCPLNHATRQYSAPESRLEQDSGKITDYVRFGCWRYHWRGTDFLVYKSMYSSRWGPRKLFYVLHADGPEKRTNDATDALLVECGKWTKDLHSEIYVFDNTQWTKSKELWKAVEGASWDDVILEGNLKERMINDVQNFFDTRKLYQASNVPWKRGVILHGVPGNGKTVSVKALINTFATREEPIPSLYVKSLDACQGPKYSIQIIFKKARAMAPCLLIFEDLDSLVTPKTRSYFLNEVDGLESNDGILMIGSTNYLNRLDASITKRPSRFDRKYHFKLPDEEARVAYALYWSRKFTGPNDIVDFPESLCPIIAKMTSGFSFAYMKELFIASLLAMARGASDGSQLEDSVAEVDPATDSVAKAPSSEKGSTISEEPVIVGKEEDKTVEESKTAVAKGTVAEVSAPPVAKGTPKIEVEIPEELKDSSFLRVVLMQATILLREMESADGGEAPLSCNDTSDEPPPFSPAWFSQAMDRAN